MMGGPLITPLRPDQFTRRDRGLRKSVVITPLGVDQSADECEASACNLGVEMETLSETAT